MYKNLSDYVKLYDNFFTKEFCCEVVKQLGHNNWEEHSFYSARNDARIKYDNELSTSYSQIPLSNEINNKLWFGIERYVLKDFSFCKDWFSGWDGYTPVRFNKYTPSTKMKLHCDHIHSMFDGMRKGIPTLTILGGLNDNYEGGEFIMWQDTEIKIPPGSLLIFPSNFMYPHEVRPVKSGTRYSFVSWVW